MLFVLGDEHINSEGAKSLAKLFKNNTSIKTLSLCTISIDFFIAMSRMKDEEIITIAEAISGFRMLKKLDLR